MRLTAFILVWLFVLIPGFAVAAQDVAAETQFAEAFFQGDWEEALKQAQGDLHRTALIHWRRGNLAALDTLIEDAGDKNAAHYLVVRLALLREGPLKALALGRTELDPLSPDPWLWVETLGAAVAAGDVRAVAEIYPLVEARQELPNEALERLCEIQWKVGWMLERPELTRQAAVELTLAGEERFAWNPRYKVLRVMYYLRAGQRIDAGDWASELHEVGARDPYGCLLPENMGLACDEATVGDNLGVSLHRAKNLVSGVENFSGLERHREALAQVVDKLEAIAPRLPETLALKGILDFGQGAEVGPPKLLQEVTKTSGLYWHFLAQAVGEPFDRRAALPWGRKACQAEPWNVNFHFAHGINCHREGAPEEALKHLDQAHALEPRMSQVWNLRTLIRSMLRDFYHHDEASFDIRMRRDEWEPFQLLLLPRVQEELAALTKRYGPPPEKLHFVFYSDKQDFDVSVFMVPSAPAIGACMGRLITMPAPGYLQYKTEPWAPVLRHEMAHAFHVHLSQGRVTRWFTEGLAHYEEVVARDIWDWQEGYDQLLVDLLATDELARFGDLNAGFNGPRARFYYQYCRWVMQWLDETFGWDKILACLHAYGEGVADANLLKHVLDLSNKEAEKQFRTWLQENVVRHIPYPPRVSGPLTNESALAEAFHKGRYRDILEATSEVSDPRLLLWRARAMEEIDDVEKAFDLYAKLVADLDDNFLFHYFYGRNLAEAGAFAKAVIHLERAVDIYPRRVDGSDHPWYWLYRSYKALEQTDKAADSIWRYTRIQQKDHRARFWLIRHYQETGAWNRVRVLLREIAEIHPYHFEAILWEAKQARSENNVDAEKRAYHRLFAIAPLTDLVDQETLWSDRERLEFLQQGIRPWLGIVSGEERIEAARMIAKVFPEHPLVRQALTEPGS